MKRLKIFFENLKRKSKSIPFLKLLIYFKTEIYAGYKIYISLRKKYGNDVEVIMCPHAGTGDVYNIGLYFKEFLKQNHIHKYTFIFRGKSEKKIGELFEIEGDTILDTDKVLKLTRFIQFVHPHNAKVIQLHHYPYVPQAHAHLEYFEGFKGLTFNEMFKYISMGLPKTAEKTIPSFKTDGELKERFEKKQLIPGKTVILAPYSSSIKYVPFSMWEDLAVLLKKKGYTVATNCVAKKEYPIAGTVALEFSYDVSIGYLEYAGYFIGIRSGICDIISTAKCKKIILYPYWDSSLPWKGIPGKTLSFYGLNNNGYCDDEIQIEFDNNSIKKIPNTIAEVLSQDNFSKQTIKLLEEIKPRFSNRTAITIVFNEYFAPIASVNLQSIIENSEEKNTYDIILFNDGLNERTKNMLNEPFKGRKNFSVRFVDYRYAIVNYSFHTERGYTPIIYGRLVIPHILKEYDKIIYLDSDTIMNSDISELYNYKMENNLIAAVRDLPMIAWASVEGSDEYKNIYEILKLDDAIQYINSGVLIINNKIFKKEFTLKQLLEYSIVRKWRWMDQDILNTLCENRILYLPQNYNVLITLRDDKKILRESPKPELINEYNKAIKDPKILHYIGCSFFSINNPTWKHFTYWKIARKTPYYEELVHRSISGCFYIPKSVELLEKITCLFRKM